MDIEPVLTKTSALVEQKLRSLVSGQPPTFTTATFRVKSTRPLQIEDADGLVMPCQNDAPKQLTIGELLAFDDYQVDLETTADNQIKHAHMTVKSLLYGTNQTKRERTFNGKFNMAAVVGHPSKGIVGCLNTLRKQKLCKSHPEGKTDVLSMVNAKDIAAVKNANNREESKQQEPIELDEDSIELLKKLSKVMTRNDLFRAAMKHQLKELDSRRTVRLMIFPDGASNGDSLVRPPKKTFSRQLITSLLNEYRK